MLLEVTKYLKIKVYNDQNKITLTNKNKTMHNFY